MKRDNLVPAFLSPWACDHKARDPTVNEFGFDTISSGRDFRPDIPRSRCLSSRRSRFLFGSFFSSEMSTARSKISDMFFKGFSTPRTSASRSNFALKPPSEAKRKLNVSGRAGSSRFGEVLGGRCLGASSTEGTGHGGLGCSLSNKESGEYSRKSDQ